MLGWAGVSICPNGQQSSWREGNDMQKPGGRCRRRFEPRCQGCRRFRMPTMASSGHGRPQETDLRARSGEGNRVWSARTGSGSLATGLTTGLRWILREIRKNLVDARAFLDWNSYRNNLKTDSIS